MEGLEDSTWTENRCHRHLGKLPLGFASFAQQKEGLGLGAGTIPKGFKQHWALAD